MITAMQIKMARAGLGITRAELAARAQIGVATLARVEAGQRCTLVISQAIQQALESARVELIDSNGVRISGESHRLSKL